MRWKGFFTAFLFLSFYFVFSQDAPPQELEEELTGLSSNIKGKLLSLKEESLAMRERLETLSRDLEKSRSEASTLAEELMMSSASLMNINEELITSYDSIARLEERVRTRTRVVIAFGVVFAVMTALKIAGYILYAKGVKVPRWLDILI